MIFHSPNQERFSCAHFTEEYDYGSSDRTTSTAYTSAVRPHPRADPICKRVPTPPAVPARSVHEASRKDTGYTTVLKQMQVMAEKGLLQRSEQFRSHVYSPRVAKGQTQQRLARNLVQRAFDGSAANLVLGALSSQKVSAAERKEIRQMLDEFEKGAR